MTPQRLFNAILGFFGAGVSSLLILPFMSFPLGVNLGLLLGCVIYAVVGVLAIVRTRHRYFFAGWLAWVVILAFYVGVTLL